MKDRTLYHIPLPIGITTHLCENCKREFIILDRSEEEERWSILGEVDYCPRCGAPHGYKVKESK